MRLCRRDEARVSYYDAAEAREHITHATAAVTNANVSERTIALTLSMVQCSALLSFCGKRHEHLLEEGGRRSKQGSEEGSLLNCSIQERGRASTLRPHGPKNRGA